MVDTTLAGLTARELECLRGVAEHKRTKVIAAELGLAPKTVDAYIAGATRKLGVGDRDSAVRVLLERDPGIWGNSPSAKTGVPEIAKVSSGPRDGRLRWPLPTRGNTRNEFSIGQSLAWIVVLSALMLATATIYMLGMRMLAEHL